MLWTFKRAPGFLADSPVLLADRISTDFHSLMLCGLLILPLLLWAGALRVGLSWHGVETPRSSQGLFAAEMSLWILSHACGCWAISFVSLLFLPFLMWLLQKVIGYKTSVQLVFDWLFRWIVLYFSCNGH